MGGAVNMVAMERASQWRLSLAALLAERYSQIPAVSAIFVGGSTARHQADRFSDIELTILWTTEPTERERAEVITHFQGGMHRLYPYDQNWHCWEDVYFLGRNQNNEAQSGCQVEVSHFLPASLDAAIDRVLRDYDPDLELQNLMAGILDSIALFNEPMIFGWKERLRQYPDGLQKAVFQRYGIIDHFWRWEMSIARGDNRMEGTLLLTTILHQCLYIVFALNRRYYGGLKWIEMILPHLTIAPPHLGERMQRVYELSLSDAAAEVRTIVAETFDLMEQHGPAVDSDRYRHIFFFQRPQPPPLSLPPL
jgi:hypothetical protein